MDVPLPKLADTLVEGTVTRWLRREGETVHRGEPLVEIETDKVNSELEAPADGILTILAAEGQTVAVGEIIARIGQPGDPDRQPSQLPAEKPGDQFDGPAAPATAGDGLSPMRRRIAERMQEARATVPQGACVREVDLSGLARNGRSWTVYFVMALATAAGADNIGVAVDVEGGLLVPVLKGVRGQSLDELSSAIGVLAGRAREGALRPADVEGADFTVTNVGSLGTLMAFPLLSPGQPGILAPGAVRDGRCYVTLCYDRRRYDDFTADLLLGRFAEEIERL